MCNACNACNVCNMINIYNMPTFLALKKRDSEVQGVLDK